MVKPQLRIGTSGWSYDHWVGPFYPTKLRRSERLTYYAHHPGSTTRHWICSHATRPHSASTSSTDSFRPGRSPPTSSTCACTAQTELTRATTTAGRSLVGPMPASVGSPLAWTSIAISTTTNPATPWPMRSRFAGCWMTGPRGRHDIQLIPRLGERGPPFGRRSGGGRLNCRILTLR